MSQAQGSVGKHSAVLKSYHPPGATSNTLCHCCYQGNKKFYHSTEIHWTTPFFLKNPQALCLLSHHAEPKGTLGNHHNQSSS